MEIKLRRAQISDIEFLFNLRNQESVRSASWNTDRVDLNAHTEWFNKSLQNPKRILYIVESGDESAGQVRFDIDESDKAAEISVSVSESFRGQGIGSGALIAAKEAFFGEFPDVGKIFAHIKTDNTASTSAFLKAGYANNGKVYYEGHECIEMVLTR